MKSRPNDRFGIISNALTAPRRRAFLFFLTNSEKNTIFVDKSRGKNPLWFLCKYLIRSLLLRNREDLYWLKIKNDVPITGDNRVPIQRARNLKKATWKPRASVSTALICRSSVLSSPF